MTSQIKLPKLVSDVRTEEKRPSSGTVKLPSTSSIFSPTTPDDDQLTTSYTTRNLNSYIKRGLTCESVKFHPKLFVLCVIAGDIHKADVHQRFTIYETHSDVRELTEVCSTFDHTAIRNLN